MFSTSVSFLPPITSGPVISISKSARHYAKMGNAASQVAIPAGTTVHSFSVAKKGAQVPLSNYKGKVLVIFNSAAQCGKHETPQIQTVKLRQTTCPHLSRLHSAARGTPGPLRQV